jgi:hypothetical protein
MRRSLKSPAFLLLALLLVGTVAGAQGVTLYVNRVVLASGNLSIGDLVRVSGPVPAAAQELLARSVAPVTDKLLYVPLSSYIADLTEAFGQNAIIVGSRSLVIPRDGPAAGESYLLDRMADYMTAQGLAGDARIEMSLVQNLTRAAAPLDGTPVFRSQKMARGVTEISFSLSDSSGNAVTGKATFTSTPAGTDTGAVMKSGSTVTVIFRKGPITIEMPGRAQASAAAGETVSVYIADSQKSFVGQVLDGKAVKVELP